MAKLLGLPMGMAPCYTLHSRITQEGQQVAAQLLTTAGANYYMDVCLGIDRMLAYFDTSAHDDQTMREVHGKQPAAEYLEWALSRGIFTREVTGRVVRGPHWGDAQSLCRERIDLEPLRAQTPSLYGLAHAGPRPADHVARAAQLNQAIAREAVHRELDIDALQQLTQFRVLRTQADSRDAHLDFPALGQRLDMQDAARLHREPHRVQIIVSDGLSAEAVHHNLPDLLPPLLDGLRARAIDHATPILVRYGRVKLTEELATRLGAELVVLLIGERPGGDALASRSLSAYLHYAAPASAGAVECSVVSNIYRGGTPPLEAAALLVEKISMILEHRAAGNRLEQLVG